jgi:hypothetical protein
LTKKFPYYNKPPENDHSGGTMAKIMTTTQGAQPESILPSPPDTPEEKNQWLSRYVYGKMPSEAERGLNFSATIDLYDAIPKFVYGPQKNSIGENIRNIKFEHHKTPYNVQITPAQIKEDDEIRYYMPGESEELVEDALRKMALEGSGVMSEKGILGVNFSLYQLHKILKDCGAERNYTQIYKSLMIMSGTGINLNCSAARKRLILVANMIPFMKIFTKDNIPPDGDTLCHVTFHPLVTRSFSLNTQRLFNIEKFFSYKHNVSRRLHKRLSHNFSTASMYNKKYFILMSSLVNDMNMRSRRWPLETYKRNILPALEELQGKNVIVSFDYERTLEQIENSTEKREDFLINMILSDQTVQEIIQANVYSGRLMEKIGSPVPLPISLMQVKPS